MNGSNRVRWEDLGQQAYEDMVAVLISRLHPTAQRIDGSGGDGGRDVQMPTEDGLVIYQLKSQTGRMTQARRRQVENSLRSASRHNPVKWFLVVPIDPTPKELEWFDRLVEPYGFECVWLGKTWLDSEMAQKPEIARYYAHGDRYELSEFLGLLRGIGPGPLLEEEGVLEVAAGNAQGIVDQLNRLDPHFVFGLAMTPNGVVQVSVIPRYPGAAIDRSPFTITLDFPDTDEGASAQQALQNTVNYGTACVVPSEFISDLVLNVPAGLGARLEGYEMALGGPTSGLEEEVRVVLMAIGNSGDVLARLPLVAQEASSGARGVITSLADKSQAVTAEIRFDVEDLTFSLRWTYSQPDVFYPLELLPAARLVAALEGGAQLAINFRGETLGPGDSGPFPSAVPGEAAEWARFLEHLTNVQMKTGAFFEVRNEFTREEASAIVQASRLLNGEKLEGTWESFSMQITPDGREAVEAALADSSPIHDVQSRCDLAIMIQGNEVRIGEVLNVFDPARVLSWEESDDSQPPGVTKLTLVPADSNRVIRSLSAASA